MKRLITIIAVVILSSFDGMAEATVVDVSTATNKVTYLLGEEVTVFVIAYNPNPELVTLSFPSALQASYLMNDVYDWSEGRQFAQVPTGVRIEAYGSYTWELTHGPDDMTVCPLDVGTHTVVGEVVGYGQSAPVQFEVIPEPMSVLLLAIGIVGVLAKHRNKLRQHKRG